MKDDTIRRVLAWSLALAPALVAPGAHAGATTDGSLGAVQTLAGRFTIPQTLGTVSGSNLFHSFRDFSVASGEAATFTTTGALQNVISRVTGGASTTINGLLQLSPATGSQPNFYFINPAGVTFGAGAVIDVPAGFFVSTAHYLKFTDGGVFHADPARSSQLSAAPPEAFGFLGTSRATIAVKDGAKLSTGVQQPVVLVAGDIDIDNGSVVAAGGDIRVVAVAQDTVEIGVDTSQPLPDVHGNLSIRNGGTLEARADISIDGGLVQVAAGDIRIDGQGSDPATGIFSNTDIEYAGNAGRVEVQSAGALTLNDGGRIASTTTAWGNAGNVIVAADRIDIDGQGKSTGIASTVAEGSSGIGGNVYLTTKGALSLRNGGIVSASTLSSGSAGTVAVSAGSIAIAGGANQGDTRTGIFSDTGNARVSDIRGHAGGIDIQAPGDLSISGGGLISSSTHTRGNAGEVRVTAANVTITDSAGIESSTTETSAGYAGRVFLTTPGALSMRSGARISTSFSGSGGTASDSASGNSGWIRVDAGSVSIDGEGQATGIFSTANPRSVASAGLVGVGASGNIVLKNGGAISSSTYSTGESGIVSVEAENILIDGQGRNSSASVGTGIFSSTRNDSGDYGSYSGNANSVDVTARNTLSLLDGGQIASATYFSGNAGKVNLTAKNLVVDGYGRAATAPASGTGVYTSSTSYGNAGDVKITAGKLSVANGAEVSSSASGEGIAGDVTIHSESATIRGIASIATSAVKGNGGNIAVQGSGVLMLDRSQISTSVSGSINGNGGNIAIAAETLVMKTGFIQANTAAPNANGGFVSIAAQNLIPSGNTLFVGGNTPYAFAPGAFGLNVIQAAAPTGVSGEIQISSPTLDVAATLVGLNAQMTRSDRLARRPCENLGGSSLAVTGRGGLPSSGADLLSPGQLIEPKPLPATTNGLSGNANAPRLAGLTSCAAGWL